MSNWIETKKQLPIDGKYVIGKHNRGTWNDLDDQENVNCVIVKLKKGISQETRRKMKAGLIPDPLCGPMWNISDGYHYAKRSSIYSADDEQGNNSCPYSFHQFGTDHFTGDEITHWKEI